MSNSSKKVVLEQVNELLHQAEEEERKYEWYNVIELLKKAEKICLDNKLKEIEAEACYKLGEIYQAAADCEKTIAKVLENFRLSISSFQKARDAYKGLKNEEKVNATLGFINLIKYISESEKGKERILLESARKYFITAKELFLKSKNSIDSLKMEILDILALSYIIRIKIRFDMEYAGSVKLISEFKVLRNKIWNRIINEKNISEIYIYYFLLAFMFVNPGVVGEIPPAILDLKQIISDGLNDVKKIIDFFNNSNKKLVLFAAYVGYVSLNNSFACRFADSIYEMKKYLKKAQKWIKKSEIILPRINNNWIRAVFYFNRRYNTGYLMVSGFFTKDLKTVLDDVDKLINYSLVVFPRYFAGYLILVILRDMAFSAIIPVVSVVQRLDFAKKALKMIKLATSEFLGEEEQYNELRIIRNVGSCLAHAAMGDLFKDKNEKSKHLQEAAKIFNTVLKLSTEKLKSSYRDATYYYHASRVSIILANNSLEKSKKVEYYLKAIDLLLISKELAYTFALVDILFLIGNIYHKVGKLTNDENAFKKSYSAYLDAIEYFKNKGYFNLVGTAYVNLAQIEDRLGNFLSAAENYQKAIDSFEQAILTLTYTRLGKKIEKLKNYMKSWNIIEVAKSYHVKEDHYKAQLSYEQAYKILKDLREYRYEAPFYSAWAILEKAEDLSKKNKHQKSASTYLESKNKFGNAIETFNSYLSKRTFSGRESNRISKLIQVAKIRERYCDARYQIETARLESKKGNHLAAAELYKKSSSLFENLCQVYKIEREKDELTAVFYLCKAWENMERAGEKQKASLYGTASQLFEKASNIFPESRMQKLSLGNSLYCSALQCGSLFDKTTELEDKIKFYKKIKMHLRDSSRNYQMGGFEQDAQWALATAVFFDGMWNLIQADNEIDGSKKGQFLNIATNYFESASTIFAQAGYEQKKDEITNYLKMIKNEQEIITSALNVIVKPAISASSVGIVAPSCPIEISSQVSLREMQQYDLQSESELNWYKRIHHIYFYTADGGCIYDQSFKAEEEVSANLVAGGLTGVDALIQEVTKTETKVKIIEKEDMTILLEHGKYVSVALVTEKNLVTLRNKMKQAVREIEDFFQEELKHFNGNITPFQKIRKFMQNIFEKHDVPVSVRPTIEEPDKPRVPEILSKTEEKPIQKKYKLIYRDLLKNYPRIQKRTFRIGIAQIGLSETGDLLNEFYEEKVSGLIGLREDKVDEISAKIKEMIELANKNGVNILCFPELTIDLNYHHLLESIFDLVKNYDMYIIPGSYHDQQTKRNISIVIGPDGILWEQEKHIPAIIHYKNHKIRENIDSGIIPRKTIICNTEFGRIAIVICRDFLDMDLRVELKNFEPPIDIIFNPAFTPVTADFKAAHFDARRSIYAYCFFVNVAEFGDSIIYTPEKECIERSIKPKEETLIFKDVDIFKLRSERKKWEVEQKKQKQFIQSTR